MNFGAYIHIPFCRGKCEYCSFYSIPCPNDSDEARLIFDAYLHSLLKDIAESNHFHGAVVDTIYFGGGTPSLFGADRISAVVRALKQCFQITPDAEISIECNPSDIADDAFLQILETGINRVTVGIQTFSEKLRNRIGRFPSHATDEQLAQFMALPDIVHGIDLMAGIPGATEEELLHDLAFAISLQPEHLSVYLLTIENNTILAKRFENNEEFQNFQRHQFATVMDFLKGAGYSHYEISNYCLPGHQSRHNLKYWTFQPYFGFGAGAHGFTREKRYYNSQSVDEYIRMPHYHEDVRSKDAAMAEYLMTALRLIDGFYEDSFFEEFGVHIPRRVKSSFKYLADEKLIHVFNEGSSRRYALTEEGIFLSDYVIYRCVESLL